MELWLRKKTKRRVRAVYRRYYRRHTHGYLTWQADGVELYNPGVETSINYVRYRHRPNPFLTSDNQLDLPIHLDPFPQQEWTGVQQRGQDWTTMRAKALQRDNAQCVICGNQTGRLEVHHLRKYKPGQPHNLDNLVTLCAACHRKARSPGSEVSRTLAGYHLKTGEPDALNGARPVRDEV
jgi:5-methylcytosine-specific restriction endonuclease McrA